MMAHMLGIRLFFGVIIVVFFAALMVNAGGDIEGAIFPIIEFRSAHVYLRNDTTVCWDLDLGKLRDADARSLAWTVIADGDNTRKAFLTPYAPEEGKMAALNERIKGGNGKRNRCFDLPPPLQGINRDLKLYIHVEYAVWHGLWLIPQDLGPIEVPPGGV
jgi:hypothetical protein